MSFDRSQSLNRPQAFHRPHISVVLAMSADGKIADFRRSPARFGSATDKAHLEAQMAQSDGVLFGGTTLRTYGTSLTITNPELLEARSQRGQSAQPVHIVCSRSGEFDPQLRFFRQPIPHWLLTSSLVDEERAIGFERVLQIGETAAGLDWPLALETLQKLGMKKLVVMGGGTLVAGLLGIDAIDELWLTVCPLLLGGRDAPTPVEGDGFVEPRPQSQGQPSTSEFDLAAIAPRLHLLEVGTIDQEVFLHYMVIHK